MIVRIGIGVVVDSEASSQSIVNIAAYQFVAIDGLPNRKAHLKSLCDQWGLKGTILLSPEGINLFLAGTRQGIDALLSDLRNDPLLSNIQVKESLSDYQPFNYMLVRVKKEIIAFGVEEIDPRQETSRKISPKELKQWLDEGKEVTLLDTRNEYEIQFGTFEGAKQLHIPHFRHFPGAVNSLPEEMKQQPIVMFCTGGIRCEKASLLMEREGFQNILQLDGGILKYFEDCGGDHWQGECFVFDQRVALDPQLQETKTKVCVACQSSLTIEDLLSDQFIPGQSCPYCVPNA
jgi:UPF0176 protein